MDHILKTAEEQFHSHISKLIMLLLQLYAVVRLCLEIVRLSGELFGINCH